MFKEVKNDIGQKIDEFCLENELPTGKVEFRNIPFSGEWGIAAPLFPLAAADRQLDRCGRRPSAAHRHSACRGRHPARHHQ